MRLTEKELKNYGIERSEGNYVRYGKVLKAKQIFTLDKFGGIFALVNEEEKFLFGLGSVK